MCKYKTHVLFVQLSPLSVARMQRFWLCHQFRFLFLMFTLLIVKHFEKYVSFENWINGLGKWANRNSYYVNNWENGSTRFLPNSAISFCDQHFLIDFMLLFRPIWQKGQENQITKQLRDESQTNPHEIRFLRGLLNKLRSSIWFTNKCKNNSLVNGLCFVFLTQKEPVHKSHLLMKPTTLGALRATIVHSLGKYFFWAINFRYAVIAAAEK